MVVEADRFFGDTRTENMTGDISLYPRLVRHYVLNPDAGGYKATLPDARSVSLREGGPVLYLTNTSAFSVSLRDNSDGVVGTIAAGKTCTVLLANNDTQAGEWYSNCATHNVTGATSAPGTTTTTTPAPTTTTTPAATTAPTTTPGLFTLMTRPNPSHTSGGTSPYITLDSTTDTPAGEHFEGAGTTARLPQVNEGL